MSHLETPVSFNPFRSVLGVCSILLLVLLGIGVTKSSRDLIAGRQREKLLESRIAASQDNVEALKQRIEGLRRDPATLEKLAREELGMAFAGDVIIVLEPDSAPAPDGTRPTSDARIGPASP